MSVAPWDWLEPVAVTVVALGVVGLVARRVVTPVLLVGLIASVVVAFRANLPWFVTAVPILLASVAVFSTLASIPTARAAGLAIVRASRSPSVLGITLIALGPTLLLVRAWVIDREWQQQSRFSPRLVNGFPVGPTTVDEAITDQGHAVPIYHLTAPERITPADRDAEDLFLHRAGASGGVVRLAGPDPSYNCHGWVFADGRGWIHGSEVDGILRDNGYERVREPMSGDLIVYRDRSGAVVHSGFVRSVLSGGQVLVESKWSHLGRFIHMASQYNDHLTTCTYYRSPREGHALHDLITE
jgi:hypothetical protein